MKSYLQRRKQFELERSLRTAILQSTRDVRTSVIESAYNELFSKFPEHSVFNASIDERRLWGKLSAGMIEPLLHETSKICEVGCGRGDTLLALKYRGHVCMGIEPSKAMLDLCQRSNLHVVLGTADRIDHPDATFDLIFSQEVIEHLHPEDVLLFFSEAYRVLKPGGIFSIETPNKTTGPQDISRGFTKVAEGLHLKEWSIRELCVQLERAGFKNVRTLLAPQFLARRHPSIHRLTRVPAGVKVVVDALLRMVPGLAFRTFVGKCIGLDDIFLFAYKPF